MINGRSASGGRYVAPVSDDGVDALLATIRSAALHEMEMAIVYAKGNAPGDNQSPLALTCAEDIYDRTYQLVV